MAKKKVAVVAQRYGLEVNGGAELHARMIAEKLSLKYDVTVLTSCALDYHLWTPEYPAGETIVNGIKVIRFNNTERIDGKPQEYLDRKFRGRHIPQKIYRWLGKPAWWTKLVPQAEITDKDGERWLELQGPGMPELKAYLQTHQEEYDAFIFFSAIYYPAAIGILTVPHKSIVVPTMHDEKPAYYPIYKKVMASARWILFNTEAEKRFSENLFPIDHVNKRIVAVGVDLHDITPDTSVLAKFNISKPYIIYIGRIDVAKGCAVMMKYFRKFIEETQSELQLVLVGKLNMEVQEHPSIIFTGFADDSDKNQLILQSEAMVIPSPYESLSLVLLESFGYHTPVIVNGETEVLKDHIDQSNGGWAYFNYDDFKNALNELLSSEDIRNGKGNAGHQYVTSKYSWDKVLHDFDEAIEDVSQQ